MPLSTAEKELIIRDFARHEGDTGSPEVQVAVLTRRIQQLTEHLKVHKLGRSIPLWLEPQPLQLGCLLSQGSP